MYRLSDEDLNLKAGFGDGDMFDELLWDNGIEPDELEVWGEFGKEEMGVAHLLIVQLVTEKLLPLLPYKKEVRTFKGIHNPLRFVDCVDPSGFKHTAVEVSSAEVLQLARSILKNSAAYRELINAKY